MDINIWVLSFIMIFMLHNLEEIITIEKWRQRTYPRIAHKIPSFIRKELESNKITTVQFAVVVFVLSVVVSGGLIYTSVFEQYFIFLGVCLFFAANIFTHPLQSLYLRCYTPGVITSLLLVIPYYSLFFYHFYDTEMFSFGTMIGAIIVIACLAPIFILSHKIGEKWK